jgi:solute carrier family 25 citrate transporter 1
MLAGLCAGVVEAVVAVTPSETIKCVSTLPSEGSLHSVRTKLIQDASSPSPMYTSSLNGTIAICRTEGFGGVYRGLTPTVRMRWDMGMAM